MLKKLFILVLSLIFILVVSEVVLRVIDRPTSIEYGWKRTDDNNIHSEDDDYVVVLLGDSQVINRGEKQRNCPVKYLKKTSTINLEQTA